MRWESLLMNVVGLLSIPAGLVFVACGLLGGWMLVVYGLLLVIADILIEGERQRALARLPSRSGGVRSPTDTA